MNLGQMVTYVSKRLIDANNEAVSVDDVKQAINESIFYWKKRRFTFNQGGFTNTLTAQNPSISVPADFYIPMQQDDGFYITYGDARHPLSRVSPAAYDGLYMANGYGLPLVYAFKAGTYQTWPIADQAYSITSNYLKQYQDLSNDSDENDFTLYASSLINSWTLANLHAELRQDDKMEAYFRSKAKDEFKELGVESNKVEASGRMSISSSLLEQ